MKQSSYVLIKDIVTDINNKNYANNNDSYFYMQFFRLKFLFKKGDIMDFKKHYFTCVYLTL
jgi:hypothetical protein